MELIFLKDALKIIDSGETFDCSFVTADKNRRTGGRIVKLKNVICTSKFYKHAIRTIKILSSGEHREFHIRLLTHFNNKKVIW